MPKINYKDIGEIQDCRYSLATIKSVDTSTDTCVLDTGDTALIFYHCTKDSTLRDNGAVENGATGFAEGDKVVVLRKIDGSKIYVIAHVDGLRSCGGVVELISAGNSYAVRYKITDSIISKTSDLIPYSPNYVIFSSYFTFKPEHPYADQTEESCVCVVNQISNLASDTVFTMSSHRNDWHYIPFAWIAWPLWLATLLCIGTPEEETMYHPGLSAAVYGGKVHWNHTVSGGTDGSRLHVIRYIDQEKRLYRPGKVDLKYDNSLDGKPVLNDDKTQKYLMTEVGKTTVIEHGLPHDIYAMSIYGKKPYTRGNDGRVTSYNERMVVGGGSWIINEGDEGSLSGGGKIQFNSTMFFWPFIPYMWEIPYFNVFECYNDDPIYGRYMGPGSGSVWIRGWDYKDQIPFSGEYNEVKHTDSAVFNGQSTQYSNYYAPRPQWIWGTDANTPSPSGSWTDVNSTSYKYTAAVTKSVPIGPVCGRKDLYVTNTIDIAGSCESNITTVNTKASTFAIYFYTHFPFYPGWWGEHYGMGTDVSTIDRDYTNHYEITGNVQSSIKVGETIIDAGIGIMSYVGHREKNVFCNIMFSIQPRASETIPGWWTFTKDSSGDRTDTELITGIMNRSMTVFAVLDYDSESNFKSKSESGITTLKEAFALVYKKITIIHNISRERTQNSIIDTQGYPDSDINNSGAGFNGWPREPGRKWDGLDLPPRFEGDTNPDDIATTDATTITGSRVVEYILYTNVDGVISTKSLATFTGGIGSGSGYRCYGIVVKVSDNVILVSYDLDKFVTPSNAQFNYDSALNYEDWNTSLSGVVMWETERRVVGIVDPNNGHECFDEFTPIPEEIYSISMKGRA
jgi:hypothetical protein